MKRKQVYRVLTLMLSIIVLLGVICGCGKKKQEIKEGTIYTTGTETFWSGIGSAYISFENKVNKDSETVSGTEKALYGKVFYINVSSKDKYEPWLQGTWDIKKGDNGKDVLVLTASWNDKDKNQTKLGDAKSGEQKEYELKDGKYEIPVELPSAKATFKLDPEANVATEKK